MVEIELQVRSFRTLDSSRMVALVLCAAPARRAIATAAQTEACSAKARWVIVPLCLTHAKAARRVGRLVYLREYALEARLNQPRRGQ